MASLKKDSLTLIILQGMNYIIPLITLPYLVRILGPTEYGNVGIAFSIIQYAILFTDFGFNLSVSKKIAQNQNDKKFISSIYINTIMNKLFLAFMSFLAIFILILFIPQLYSIRYMILCGFLQILASVFIPIWLFQGLEKSSIYSFISIFIKALIIPLTFFLVKDSNDGYLSLLIQGGVLFFTAIIAIIYAFHYKYIEFARPNLKQMYSLLIESTPMFLGIITISLYTLSTPLVLGIMNTSDEVGFYSAADKVRGAFLGIFLVLGGVLYPRISKLMHTDLNAAFRFIKKLFQISIVLLGISAISFYILSSYITNLVLGDQYQDSIILIQIMSPMILLIPLSVVLSNYILLAAGHSNLFAKIPIITFCFHMSYVFILSKWYGAIGASIAILITEIVSFLLLLIINIKKGYIYKVIKA